MDEVKSFPRAYLKFSNTLRHVLGEADLDDGGCFGPKEVNEAATSTRFATTVHGGLAYTTENCERAGAPSPGVIEGG